MPGVLERARAIFAGAGKLSHDLRDGLRHREVANPPTRFFSQGGRAWRRRSAASSKPAASCGVRSMASHRSDQGTHSPRRSASSSEDCKEL
jgi:hypothetical protein